MNPQASLNLNDIILPDPVGWWPLAIGWWLLIALVIVLVLAVVATLHWRRRRKRQQAPYRACRHQLQQLLSQDHELTPELCAAVNQQLKIYCRHRFPTAVALYGQRWSEFLQQQSPQLSDAQRTALADGPYVQHVSGRSAALLEALLPWLQQAEKNARRAA